MARLRLRARYWIGKRFVHIIEFIGYLVVGIVAVALVSSFYVQIPLRARSDDGAIEPFRVNLTADDECVVISFSVSQGDAVSQSDDVCRVVTDPEIRQRARVYFATNNLVNSLEQIDSSDLERARETMAKVRNEIVVPAQTTVLEAPADGRIEIPDTIKPGSVVKRGEVVAQVLRFNRLVLRGTLQPHNANKVKPGNAVRAEMPDGILIEGEIVERAEGAARFTSEFENVPQDAIAFVEERFERGEESIAAESTQVIIGKQNLFSFLFAGKK